MTYRTLSLPPGGSIPGPAPPSGNGCSTSVTDIVFVVDSSGSIRDQNPADGSHDNWALALGFIRDIVEELNIGEFGVRVGMVVYSQLAKNEFYLNTYYNKVDIQNKVLSTSYMGSYTNTSGGIRLMHFEQFIASRGKRSGVRSVAIVITDGESNLDQQRTISDAEAARAANIEIIVVGITNAVNIAEVSGISSVPQIQDQNWHTAADFVTLSEIVDDIAQSTCDSKCIQRYGCGKANPLTIKKAVGCRPHDFSKNHSCNIRRDLFLSWLPGAYLALGYLQPARWHGYSVHKNFPAQCRSVRGGSRLEKNIHWNWFRCLHV